MVTAVSGSLLPALLPGSPAATKLAQQNAVLPSPLQPPEEQAGQRASALLRFDRPQVAQSTLADLQDSALRNAVAPEQSSSTDSSMRAALAYQAVQQTLRPLLELSTPPRPVPNPAGLAPGAAEESDAERGRISERARGREDARETQPNRETGRERGDERSTSVSVVGSNVSPGAQVDLGA